MTASTQLDLARAYIEMADLSAARKVLDEVVQHGDSSQKEGTRSLLTRLKARGRF